MRDKLYQELVALQPKQKKDNLQLTFSVFRFTVAGKLIGESIRQTLAGNFACKKRNNCD